MTQVEIQGLAEFRRALRNSAARSSNVMRTLHRKVADLVAGRAQGSAGSMGSAIKPRATNTSAKIETVAKPPQALTVFWGAKRKTGWYAAPQYSGSTGRQFPPWVGNQWSPGETGGEPYHIGPAINSSIPAVMDLYEKGIDEIVKEAFPT